MFSCRIQISIRLMNLGDNQQQLQPQWIRIWDKARKQWIRNLLLLFTKLLKCWHIILTWCSLPAPSSDILCQYLLLSKEWNMLVMGLFCPPHNPDCWRWLDWIIFDNIMYFYIFNICAGNKEDLMGSRRYLSRDCASQSVVYGWCRW